MRREVGQDELDSCWLRFWAKVDVREPGDCWEWKGAKSQNGYGQLRFGVAPVLLAHRVAWRLIIGEVPEGMNVLHRCDHRLCVNPSHLWIGTQQENLLDMVRKGRWRPAAVRPATTPRVLTPEFVAELRRLHFEQEITQVELAERFHVSVASVNKVCKGKGRGKGRRRSAPCGERANNAKLTEESALEILAKHRQGHSQVDLAREYGVAASTISALIRGQNWKHLRRKP